MTAQKNDVSSRFYRLETSFLFSFQLLQMNRIDIDQFT